ncbi:hypothetical protein BU17DRAFT_101199 [Hysterangium stoloniferum]|nr:hypothetical protein BU17DRAFT_101199 [Hysterangium stoloniferum]
MLPRVEGGAPKMSSSGLTTAQSHTSALRPHSPHFYKFNDDLPFNSPAVIASVAICIVTFIVFVLFELLIAPEPILAPCLLRKKVPILIGTSDLLATMCNFAIIYFFPMYFETVMLTSASTAGAHLLPNRISMSTGSLFAMDYVKNREVQDHRHDIWYMSGNCGCTDKPINILANIAERGKRIPPGEIHERWWCR